MHTYLEFSELQNLKLRFPKMNTPRALHGCAKIKRNSESHFVVAGGTGKNAEILDTVEILKISRLDDYEGTSWLKLGRLNAPRSYFPTIGVLNSKVLPDFSTQI